MKTAHEFPEADALLNWLKTWGVSTRGERAAFIDGLRTAQRLQDQRALDTVITGIEKLIVRDMVSDYYKGVEDGLHRALSLVRNIRNQQWTQ